MIGRFGLPMKKYAYLYYLRQSPFFQYKLLELKNRYR